LSKVTVGIGRRDSNYVGKSWGIFSMFAVDVCRLPETGGSIFVVVAGVFLLIAGVIVTRWVRASAGRMSVMVAPLVLLGGLVLAPSVTDPCVPTTTVIATTTTVAPVVYSLGDTGPSGGIIFYVDRTRAEGSQYFEAACVGWSDGTCGGDDATDPKAEWGCFGSPITGADVTAIGTGEQNSADIVIGCATDGIAARLANALVLGGQSDWFLPSLDELNALCKWAHGDNLNTVCNINGSGNLTLTYGGFAPGGYWSSSEFSASIAWSQFFLLGGQSDSDKDNVRYVRPVRAF
jgi:hypothetical protein